MTQTSKLRDGQRAFTVTRRRFLALTGTTAGAAIAASTLGFAVSSHAVQAACNQKSVTFARGDELRTQDPQEISGLMEGTIAGLLYDPLIDTTAKLEQIPGLATEWKMAADGLSYAFKLREGVQFHDGTPFTADDVEFTFDRLLQNSQLQHAAVWLDQLKEVRVDDPLSVTFLLKAPNPGLITNFSAEPILAHNAIEKYGEKFYEKGIGTGPFTFKEWGKNQRWVGEAFPGYWNKEAVHLNQVIFRPITEAATRIAALQTGEVDIIDSLSGDEAQQLGDQPNIKIDRSPSTDTIQFTFNLSRAPFNNADARWAVAHAIDYNAIVNDIVHAGQVVAAPIPPGTVGYDEALVKAVPEYNLDTAKGFLSKAGVAPGTKIKFILNPAWFAKLDLVAEYISEQLRSIGFDVDMQFMEPGAYTEARKSRDFDIAVQQANKGQNPDTNYTVLNVYGTFGSDLAKVRPDIIQMINQARTELDAQKRDELYRNIQHAMYDMMAELILYRQEYIWGVRDRVQNFEARADFETRVDYVDVTC